MDNKKIKFDIIKKYQISTQGNSTLCDSMEDVENRIRGLLNSYYHDAYEINRRSSESFKMKYAIDRYMENPFIISEKMVLVPSLICSNRVAKKCMEVKE